MGDVIEFKYSDSKYMKLFLSSEEKNINPYINVSIKYFNDRGEYELFTNDFISEAIKTLNYSLTKALNFELQMNNEYIERGIGFYHNMYSHELWTDDNLDIDDPAENFIVWSSSSDIGIQTYIYNIQDEIYFEISRTYKWHSDYPDDETEYQTFEEYINQHEIIDVLKINQEIALKWNKKCTDLLKMLKFMQP
ncbi:hypothetical protein [Paenibacillus fonticola]|uniref:hypothetical protein n=1 Tax=Paenibacillus fonticola TaxID=379896 RepID=UPI00037C0DD1|nr:hypothetical protein [Paenibacillus fonticola]